MKKDIHFTGSLFSFIGRPDQRPRIDSAGINGKQAWVHIDFEGVQFTSQCSKALVRQLNKIHKDRVIS